MAEGAGPGRRLGRLAGGRSARRKQRALRWYGGGSV